MRGDPASLFDAHAARLHAYCWSLVGDATAATAVTDTFAAAVQHPPRGDSVLWLYALSRSACAERGAFGAPGVLPPFGTNDPLLRAAGTLRPDHREALVLEAGEWLEVGDISRVLGVAPDTARQLLHAARTRLERAVLDTLMRGAGDTELINAFEKGRLPKLLADRAPATAPDWLRERVLAACEAESARPLSAVVAPSPLVVIGSETKAKGRTRRGMAKSVGAVAGLAASVAAAISVLASWPTAKSTSVGAATPSSANGQATPLTDRTSARTTAPVPVRPGEERAGAVAEHTSATPYGQDPTASAPGAYPPDARPGAQPTEPGTGTPDETSKPPKDDASKPPATDPPPTTPPTTEPPDETDPPTTPPPTTPEEPAEPPTDPEPSPTSNPAPSPSE